MTWFLLWPDFHRLAIVNFQDARSTVHLLGGPAIRQAGEVYRNKPARRKFTQANLDITFARPNWTQSAFLAALKPNQNQL